MIRVQKPGPFRPFVTRGGGRALLVHETLSTFSIFSMKPTTFSRKSSVCGPFRPEYCLHLTQDGGTSTDTVRPCRGESMASYKRSAARVGRRERHRAYSGQYIRHKIINLPLCFGQSSSGMYYTVQNAVWFCLLLFDSIILSIIFHSLHMYPAE